MVPYPTKLRGFERNCTLLPGKDNVFARASSLRGEITRQEVSSTATTAQDDGGLGGLPEQTQECLRKHVDNSNREVNAVTLHIELLLFVLPKSTHTSRATRLSGKRLDAALKLIVIDV